MLVSKDNEICSRRYFFALAGTRDKIRKNGERASASKSERTTTTERNEQNQIVNARTQPFSAVLAIALVILAATGTIVLTVVICSGPLPSIQKGQKDKSREENSTRICTHLLSNFQSVTFSR